MKQYYKTFYENNTVGFWGYSKYMNTIFQNFKMDTFMSVAEGGRYSKLMHISMMVYFSYN